MNNLINNLPTKGDEKVLVAMEILLKTLAQYRAKLKKNRGLPMENFYKQQIKETKSKLQNLKQLKKSDQATLTIVEEEIIKKYKQTEKNFKSTITAKNNPIFQK